MPRHKKWDILGYRRYLKAIVGFFAPSLTVLASKLEAGITGSELALGVVSGIVTSLVVWAVPNSD